MADGIVLTPDAYQKLRDMYAQMKRMLDQGPPRRPPAEDDPALAPECHLVLTPSGGVADLDEGPDTGTAYGGGDLPGYAECDVYRVVEGEGGPEMEAVEGLTLRVHNVATVPIPGGMWALAIRDKFGEWFFAPWYAVEEVPGTSTSTSTAGVNALEVVTGVTLSCVDGEAHAEVTTAVIYGDFEFFEE
jgi:hypothetical protein